jgi:hypothetical protein
MKKTGGANRKYMKTKGETKQATTLGDDSNSEMLSAAGGRAVPR